MTASPTLFRLQAPDTLSYKLQQHPTPAYAQQTASNILFFATMSTIITPEGIASLAQLNYLRLQNFDNKVEPRILGGLKIHS